MAKNNYGEGDYTFRLYYKNGDDEKVWVHAMNYDDAVDRLENDVDEYRNAEDYDFVKYDPCKEW